MRGSLTICQASILVPLGWRVATSRNFPVSVSPALIGCCAFATVQIGCVTNPAIRPNRASRKIGIAASSMRGHDAPLGDHGLAHLPGILGAGDFIDLDRDFLADEI